MDTEFLVQMRQSNKCGRDRNDEIFNILFTNSEYVKETNTGSKITPRFNIKEIVVLVAFFIKQDPFKLKIVCPFNHPEP